IASADRYGSPQYGSHLERYLVDALRRLTRGNSAWLPNRDKSRLWFGQDGLFLIWPGGAEDIHQLLEADQLAGIPKAPETVLELLLAAGVFEAATAGRSTWSIQPPGAKAPLEAVKLSAPAILLAGIDPPPVALPQALEFKPERAPAPPAPQAPEPASVTPVKSGTQLSLIPPPEPPAGSKASAAVENAPDPSPPEPVSEPPPATFALQAPMRLNPVVRDALAEAIRTLNDGMGPPAVCTIAQGVFVPLAEFERRGIQPSLAMRALAETRMLVRPTRDGPPTLSRDFNGHPTVGLVLDPRCVRGLDLAGFVAPPVEAG
ncbi:MAG: TraI domain-containing protein, partial [Rhodocyclaceae bacterium]|nr:TraI domain-containing protein [Rhodocyclaceae bacterium]